MPIRPVSRTRHDQLDADTPAPRAGATSHEESGTDVAEYVQALEQAHLTALHGTGIAAGLALSAVIGDSRIRIGAGVAVDAVGRHIVLAPGGRVEVSSNPDANSVLLATTDDGVQLSTVGHSGRCAVSVLWRETFDEALLAETTEVPPLRFVQRHTPWIRLVSDGGPDPDHGGVALGTVELDQDGVVLDDGVSSAGRAGPEPAVQALRLRGPFLDAQPEIGTVSDELAGRLVAHAGTVRLESGTAGLAVGAGKVAFRGPDDTERVVVDTGTGRIGLGTGTPRNPLGIRATGNAQELVSFEDPAGVTAWHVNQNVRGNPGLNFAESRVADGRLFLEAGGNVGIGTVNPTHPLHVPAAQGIRQGNLHVSGSGRRSGIAYNAFRNAGNTDWVFPDPSRPAMAIELDDRTNLPVIRVLTTAEDDNTVFRTRVRINGRTGDTHILGTLSATTKQFLVDHPLDPENRVLAHSSVESSEMTTVYSGNVELDDAGGATVALPDWMEALNTDFRYQLTCIGAAAPVYVAREVGDGSFAIAGGTPGLKVSWQLTGVRQDAWARAHPLVVDSPKSVEERGRHLHPEVYAAHS